MIVDRRLVIAGLIFMGLMALSFFLGTAAVGRAQASTYVTVRDETASNKQDFKSISAQCPEDMIAISGGAGIYYDSDAEAPNLPLLVSSFMYPDERTWYAEAVQPANSQAFWSLEVHVTCVTDD